MRGLWRALVALFGLTIAVLASAQPRGPLVLAAASLQEAMTDAADAWAKTGHPHPVLSFAASSALARQAASTGGGRGGADLFASADEQWMDFLARADRLEPGTRADVAGNRLVIVAPAATTGRPTFAELAKGPVAMADPRSVPAGLYGKASLTRLGAWTIVGPHVVAAESVRAALALVERGAAPYGIVYATDALASRKVRVAGVFPDASHPPITYPVARLKGSASPDAEGFRRFLLSPGGQAIFRRHGFTPAR